jgi:hypothetical protein
LEAFYDENSRKEGVRESGEFGEGSPWKRGRVSKD